MSNPKNSKFKDQRPFNPQQMGQLDNMNQFGPKNSPLDEMVIKNITNHSKQNNL